MLNEIAKNGKKIAIVYYPEFLRSLKESFVDTDEYRNRFNFINGISERKILLKKFNNKKGILYFSSIDKMPRKSVSKEQEKLIISTSFGLINVFSVSVKTLSTKIPSMQSIILNTDKKPSEAIPKL